MGKLPIVAIGVMVVLALAYSIVQSRKRRPDKECQISVGSNQDEPINGALLGELSQLERLFVSYLVAERMSEESVPFAKRDAFWRDFPHVRSKPVIDLEQMAKAANMDYATMTTQLTRWLTSKGVIQHASVSTMLETYMMDKSKTDAEIVYAKYTTDA